MKTCFIKDKPERYRRRWFAPYYAITEYGGHITDDYTLHQAIFMAHDLLACLYSPGQEASVLSSADMGKRIEEYFHGLPIIGTMDIDVDVVKGVWVRKGDLPPATRQHLRTKQYRKAFAMTYKDVAFN